MGLQKLGCWAVLLAAGCDGRLTVDDGNAAAGVPGANENAGSSPSGELAGMPGIPDSGAGGLSGNPGVAVPSDAGKIGKACIPGDLVIDSRGNAAEAVTKTLSRCDAGLSCNSKGTCVAAPDCQHNEAVCILRQVESVERIAKVSPDAHTGIVALAASESRIYWLEFGTVDPVGNYQHDGALMSYSIATRTTTMVASGLDGPTQLELTTSHAYVVAYGGLPDEGARLLRVPLTGGSVELVQQYETGGARFLDFAAAGNRTFWSDGDTVYSMSSEADATPTEFLSVDPDEQTAQQLASDGTDLFYLSRTPTGYEVMRTPVANAAPTATGASGFYDLALHDDGVFTFKTVVKGTGTSLPQGVLLARAPKRGGEFETVRPLGDGYPLTLQVVGDRYFFDVRHLLKDRDGIEGYERRVMTATFADEEPATRLVQWPETQASESLRRLDLFHYAGTAERVYWSDGLAIYQQPIPTP